MKICYDFHIHTALSPCGHEDMTPNNIVNMALMNELDAIAITDHNTCENVAAVMKVAEGTGLLVLPGMEVESREEIHVVCLFSALEDVYNMQNTVYSNLPEMRNKAKIFGRQSVIDENDDEVKVLDKLLSFATQLSLEEIVELAQQNNGVAIPAHIDRPSYSVISNLGLIPVNLRVTTLEVSRFASKKEYEEKYPNYQIIQSSDAHELGFIGAAKGTLDVTTKAIASILDVFKYLKQ